MKGMDKAMMDRAHANAMAGVAKKKRKGAKSTKKKLVARAKC